MPDQREIIDLNVATEESEAKVDRLNKKIEETEQQSIAAGAELQKAVDKTGEAAKRAEDQVKKVNASVAHGADAQAKTLQRNADALRKLQAASVPSQTQPRAQQADAVRSQIANTQAIRSAASASSSGLVQIQPAANAATAAVSNLSSGLKAVGGDAARAGAAISAAMDRATVRVEVTDRTLQQMRRRMDALEKRTAVATKSPTELLAAGREADLKFFKGDPRAVERATILHDRLLENQRSKETATSLERAIDASRRAELGTRKFQSALVDVNREGAKAAAQSESEISALEKRVRGTVKPESSRIFQERDDFLARAQAGRGGLGGGSGGGGALGAGFSDDQIRRATAAFDELYSAQHRVEQKSESLRAVLKNTGESLYAIGRNLFFFLTLPFILAGAQAVKLYGELRQAELGFTAMFKSAEKAQSFIAELKTFALTTPFEFKDLIPASQRMRAFGFETNQIIPILGILANRAVAVGGGMSAGKEAIDRMGLALGQMHSKGRVLAQDVNQLAEAGVNVWQTLANKIGVSVPMAMKMAEDGVISARVAIPAILRQMLDESKGLIDEANRTTLGQFSNLKDRLTFLLQAIGKAIDPLAATIVRFGTYAITGLGSVVTGFQELNPIVRDAALAIVALTLATGPAIYGLSALVRTLAFFYGATFVSSITNIRNFGTSIFFLAQMLTTTTVGPLTAFQAGLRTTIPLVAKLTGVIAAGIGLGYLLARSLREAFPQEGLKEALALQDLAAKRTQEENVNMEAHLRKRGQIMEQGSEDTFTYFDRLRQATKQFDVLDQMDREANKRELSLKQLQEIAAAEKRATEFRDASMARELQGMEKVQEVRTHQTRETGRFSATAQADIERGVAAQRLKVVDDAEKKARAFRDQAMVKELTGIAKFAEQRREALVELDKQGLGTFAAGAKPAAIEAERAKRQEAIRLINEGAVASTDKYNADLLKQAQEFSDQSVNKTVEGYDKIEELRRENVKKAKGNAAALAVVNASILNSQRHLTEETEREVRKQIAQREIAGLDIQRDAQVRQIQLAEAQTIRSGDSLGVKTLRQKLELEDKKSKIEASFALKRLDLESKAVQQRAVQDQSEATTLAEKNRIAIKAQQDLLNLESKSVGQVEAIREQAAIRSAELVRDQQQRIFDNIQRQAEGLFDAMIHGAKSFGDAVKRIAFAAILTPVKQAFSNAVATLIAGVQTNQGVLGKIVGGSFDTEGPRRKLEELKKLDDRVIANIAATYSEPFARAEAGLTGLISNSKRGLDLVAGNFSEALSRTSDAADRIFKSIAGNADVHFAQPFAFAVAAVDRFIAYANDSLGKLTFTTQQAFAAASAGAGGAIGNLQAGQIQESRRAVESVGAAVKQIGADSTKAGKEFLDGFVRPVAKAEQIRSGGEYSVVANLISGAGNLLSGLYDKVKTYRAQTMASATTDAIGIFQPQAIQELVNAKKLEEEKTRLAAEAEVRRQQNTIDLSKRFTFASRPPLAPKLPNIQPQLDQVSRIAAQSSASIGDSYQQGFAAAGGAATSAASHAIGAIGRIDTTVASSVAKTETAASRMAVAIEKPFAGGVVAAQQFAIKADDAFKEITASAEAAVRSATSGLATVGSANPVGPVLDQMTVSLEALTAAGDGYGQSALVTSDATLNMAGAVQLGVGAVQSLTGAFAQLSRSPLSFLKSATGAISGLFGAILGGRQQVAGQATSSGGGGGGGLASVLGAFGGFGGISRPGAPGGTPGFAGPVGSAGGGGGFLTGLKGQGSGLLGSLKSLGNIGFGPKGGDFGGEVAGSFKGLGGTAGGLALIGGGILGFDGLRRGGIAGLAETTAGGALIGAKFGGPVGAAIGAGVGALAGIVRLFIHGSVEKIVEKVKTLYGVRLEKNFAKDPILGIIKQNFGGNIDVGIRSPQVRDLIELYAMSTGQRVGPLGSNALKPLTFYDKGSAGIFEQSTYFNGTGYQGSSRLLNLNNPATRAAAQQAVTDPPPQITVENLHLTVDGKEGIGNLLDGRAAAVISKSPREVVKAQATAQQYSMNRELFAKQFGVITG